MYSLECEAAVNEQEKRGGRVQLEPMVIPQSEFDYADTGDVLMLSMNLELLIRVHKALELALSLEKLVNAKLLYVFFFKDGFLI
ncbi:hypothetical protein Bca101_051892 [Brassica carinata]